MMAPYSLQRRHTLVGATNTSSAWQLVVDRDHPTAAGAAVAGGGLQPPGDSATPAAPCLVASCLPVAAQGGCATSSAAGACMVNNQVSSADHHARCTLEQPRQAPYANDCLQGWCWVAAGGLPAKV